MDSIDGDSKPETISDAIRSLNSIGARGTPLGDLVNKIAGDAVENVK